MGCTRITGASRSPPATSRRRAFTRPRAFPGYPVQEYVCSWFWRTGPAGLNALDAFFCMAAVVWFALICREYGCRDWWLAGLALAFVPIVYVNSVASKDFLWALAFLLGAWWCAMRRYPIRAGLLLGLAMGCRITSGAAALPIIAGAGGGPAEPPGVAVGVSGGRGRRRCRARGLYARLLALWRRFFTFYADHGFPDALLLARRATVEVWGILGLAGLGLAFCRGAFGRSPRRRPGGAPAPSAGLGA